MCLASERMIFANFYNKTKVSSCKKKQRNLQFSSPQGEISSDFWADD